MPTCAAIKCTNRSDRGGQPFFRFPFGDSMRLLQWVKNVRRNNWTPTEHSRLCACHFEEECFILRGGIKSLTSTAVPTIFNYFPLTVRNTTTQTKVSFLSTRGFADSFDHKYSKHHTESRDFTTAGFLETKSRRSHAADDDSAAKVAELKSEKELVVDLEITVDQELAIIQEVTVKEEFKVEEDISCYEEIAAVEEVERLPPNTEAQAAATRETTANDHNYTLSKSPRTLRQELLSVEEKLQSCRKKLKVEKVKTKRLLKTVHSLTKVICVLNQNIRT